ncbi:FAD-dependent oxidoreductase [Geomesophilobacter sediminis]|uniref:FAD-dependent oxidoreductase n=1 Tax=Geomesophilobacter sediminis TaxID=2798584 RepID=A0A8J7IPW9_9BACT|nr:FAD-dependent oxidoreductase [Geomesophilobacter sediminis]MBJ6725748.1 FAD-dependent oxidoreductase [Geomesophilobacter sediminis]
MKKYVIIGGVAAGMSAAARLRRLDEQAEIVVLERGDYVSYANCGLPYYIGDVITERSALLLQTPASFHQRFNVDVRTGSEAIAVDPTKRTVKVRELKSGREYDLSYDNLLLAPGGSPVKPAIAGADHPAIHTLWTIPDTDRLRQMVDDGAVKRALVVGAGFIGLEMAENLHARGIEVTVVEMAEQALSVIDYEMAAVVHRELLMKKVPFHLKDAVASFAANPEGGVTATLASGKAVAADLVLLSIGVRPNTDFLKGSGIKLGERGHIIVDDTLRTGSAGIYAAGDAIEVVNPLTGKQTAIPLAGPANKQGRIAADNMHGNRPRSYGGTMGTAIAKVFDLDVGVTGLTEKLCRAEGIACQSVIVHPNDHAGYYPGAAPLTFKLIFSPKDRRVLGAQCVGYGGVDKRIDVIAAAIKGKMTVDDLTEIEHAYAPPYSSAKDPVNMAGFAAQNILDGLLQVIGWRALQQIDRTKVTLLDVRTVEEFKGGSIAGAINIPLDELRARIGELPPQKPVIVFCKVGLRGYLACRILSAAGITDCCNLSGGYDTWCLATTSSDELDTVCPVASIKDRKAMEASSVPARRVVEVNACGLQCPGPIMRLKKEIDAISPGEAVAISASDAGFYKDAESWANSTGNILAEITAEKGIIRAVIVKGNGLPAPLPGRGNDKTIVVFSGDLDKALASFVIANGALAMGRKVTMFFTFWGLNVLRRHEPVALATGKNLIEKAFELMMPRGSRKLSLSRMSMGGMGDALIKGIMKNKNVPALEEMIELALAGGARLVACQMSMDLMGIRHEELIDGVELGGVAAYLEASEKADANLFI